MSINQPQPGLWHFGQALTQHHIVTTLIDVVQGRLDITVGSWADADTDADAGTRSPVLATTVLTVNYDQWQPGYFAQVIDTVNAHPAWTGLAPHPPNRFCRFHWPSQQWQDPRHVEDQWLKVRQQRNQLLLGSDWTQLPDVPLPLKTDWASYRQALRDITQQSDPFEIAWPARPTAAEAATPPDPSV
jgi:hypothetical protein